MMTPGNPQPNASHPSGASRGGNWYRANHLLRTWGEFIKFSHTVFAMPFALASMAIAARDHHGWPGIQTFLLILVAMTCARTAAMAFNRIVDRHYDRANPRTAGRHLPAGKISLASAWSLFGLSTAGFLGASYGLNSLCFLLAPVALFVVCFYSFTKRFTDFTHIFLGVALALAPLGAWIAVRGELQLLPLRHGALVPILLAAVVVFWLTGFDIIYATQDYEFDKQHGLHSLVVRWGIPAALRFAFRCHLIMWGLLLALGLLSGFRLAYFLCLVIVLASLAVEHWLAQKRDIKWIQVAFFRLNALISVVFLAGVLVEVIFPGYLKVS